MRTIVALVIVTAALLSTACWSSPVAPTSAKESDSAPCLACQPKPPCLACPAPRPPIR